MRSEGTENGLSLIYNCYCRPTSSVDEPWLIMSSSCMAMPGTENFDTPKTQPVPFRIICPSMSTNVCIGGFVSCSAVVATQFLNGSGAT